MSYDDDSISYTLTTHGWVTDSNHPDAIEIWIRTVSQASGWSNEYVSWSCKWANPNVSRAERDKIRKQYQDFMGRKGRYGNKETTIGEPI
jgi:hypothetical protein